MLVTSQLPIQTKKIFIVFDVHLCPPLWKRFRHPYVAPAGCLNLSRLHAKTKTKRVLIRELL